MYKFNINLNNKLETQSQFLTCCPKDKGIKNVPIFDSCAKLHQEHLTQNTIIF